MTTNFEKNLIASIRDRLKLISRKRKEDFQFVLTRYALERLLYRLSQSRYANRFVLKGAFLFMVWTGNPYRQTKDLDLLGLDSVSPETLQQLFDEICRTETLQDGLIFDLDTIEITEIRDDTEYQGWRVKIISRLGKARIPLQIDIGFGDAITPKPLKGKFPTYLDMPAPRLWIYPKETVVAEKLQIIVDLGIQNSRMKDFYDLYVMANLFNFDGLLIVKAIRATFDRRKTELPPHTPLALTKEFTKDEQKQIQWKAFLQKSGLHGSDELGNIIEQLKDFLIPPLTAAARNDNFRKTWEKNGPWRNTEK